MREKQGRDEDSESILRSGKQASRIKQWRWAIQALPKCTLVSDQYDPSIGGAISDPV